MTITLDPDDTGSALEQKVNSIPVGEVLHGNQIYAWTLKQLGMEKVLFYIGGPIIGIAEKIEREVGGIEVIIGPDEIDLGHAAEGYFRVTRKPLNVLYTSGVAVKAASPLLAATLDSASIIVTVGQVPYEGLEIGDELFQGARLKEPLREYVKWAYRIPSADMIQPALKTAYHQATSGRPGAILLELAASISQAETAVLKDLSEVNLINVRKKRPKVYSIVPVERTNLESLREDMDRAQRPVIMAGGGVHYAGAVDQMMDYAKMTDTPIVSTLMLLGAMNQKISGAHADSMERLYQGMTGMHGSIWAQLAVHNSDVLVGMGNRFDNRITLNAKEFAPDAKIYWINPHEPGISKIMAGRLKKIDMGAKEALEALAANGSNHTHDRWISQLQEWRLKYEMPTHVPREVIQSIRALTRMHEPMEPYVTTGVGQHQMFLAEFWDFFAEGGKNMLLTSGALAPMGAGLPFAVGALLAEPNRPVYVFNGDGSAVMDIRSLLFGYLLKDRLAENNNGIKEVIFRDNTLGMVRNWQKNMYHGRFHATDLSTLIPPNYFADSARAAQFSYYRANYIDGSPENNRRVMEHFVRHRGNAILEVLMLPEEALPFTPGFTYVRDAFLPNGRKVDQADLAVGKNWTAR